MSPKALGFGLVLALGLTTMGNAFAQGGGGGTPSLSSQLAGAREKGQRVDCQPHGSN